MVGFEGNVMSPISEETTFDLAFVDQWFRSKPHLPLVRDYLSPRVENLSLSHAAPESVLQLVKLPEPEESSESAVEKIQEQELKVEEIEPVLGTVVSLPEENVENQIEAGNTVSGSNIKETKRSRYAFIGVAILLILISLVFFINTDKNGAPSAQSGNSVNGSHIVADKPPNEIVSSHDEPEVPIEPPIVVSEPRFVVPIEPPPQPTAVELVRAYFENINEGEADLAISKWKSPPKNLMRLIEGAKWFKINEIHFISQFADKAEVSVNVTGREKGNMTEENWAGTIVLEKVGGEWKISKMRLSQI